MPHFMMVAFRDALMVSPLLSTVMMMAPKKVRNTTLMHARGVAILRKPKGGRSMKKPSMNA